MSHRKCIFLINQSDYKSVFDIIIQIKVFNGKLEKLDYKAFHVNLLWF